MVISRTSHERRSVLTHQGQNPSQFAITEEFAMMIEVAFFILTGKIAGAIVLVVILTVLSAAFLHLFLP
jgi:hypothetical protein